MEEKKLLLKKLLLEQFIIHKNPLCYERIENTLITTNKYTEFIYVLETILDIKLEETKLEDWDVVELYNTQDEQDVNEQNNTDYCICTQHIKNDYIIEYKPTNERFQVGCDCVLKHIPSLKDRLKEIKDRLKEIKKEIKINKKKYDKVVQEIKELLLKFEGKADLILLQYRKNIWLKEEEEKRKVANAEARAKAEREEASRKMIERKIKTIGKWKVLFGKYKDLTYDELFERDKSYCRFMLQDKFKCKEEIKFYLKSKLNK